MLLLAPQACVVSPGSGSMAVRSSRTCPTPICSFTAAPLSSSSAGGDSLCILPCSTRACPSKAECSQEAVAGAGAVLDARRRRQRCRRCRKGRRLQPQRESGRGMPEGSKRPLILLCPVSARWDSSTAEIPSLLHCSLPQSGTLSRDQPTKFLHRKACRQAGRQLHLFVYQAGMQVSSKRFPPQVPPNED